MLRALLHTNYIKLSLVVRTAELRTYIKATPFTEGVASHRCRHGKPGTFTVFEKEKRVGIVFAECRSVSSRLLSLSLFDTFAALVSEPDPRVWFRDYTRMGKLLCSTVVATLLIAVPKVPLCYPCRLLECIMQLRR